MKLFLFILLIFSSTFQVSGQTNEQTSTSSLSLSSTEVKKIFTHEILKKYNIEYDIFRVYNYSDKTGKYYMVLTEKADTVIQLKDTLHYKIKALNFKSSLGDLTKLWEINDFRIKQVNGGKYENTIWFWTKYCEFQDLDKDGIIDPIIVYGTTGMNGRDDGRIKVLTFYKGQKNVIRHQNGVLDFERNTQIDETFYSLPASIQDHVKKIMQKIMDNSHGIFPYGWQTAMKNHKTKFQEKQNGY